MKYHTFSLHNANIAVKVFVDKTLLRKVVLFILGLHTVKNNFKRCCLAIKFVMFESTRPIFEKKSPKVEVFVYICLLALDFCGIRQEVGYAEVKYERIY